MKRKMKHEIKYRSKDKMYNIKNKKKELKQSFVVCLFIISLVLLGSGFYISVLSFQDNKNDGITRYNEKGKADYVVYLKENSFYDTNYLDSGMQYVASLINTINTNFNYEIHSDNNLDYQYKYRIVGTLQIMDPQDSSKILYSKDYELLQPVMQNLNSNNMVINENVNIDYDKYNNYVNSYKKEYGVSVDSRLVVTMYIEVDGQLNSTAEKLNKNSELQITIPLSEQTVDISIDTANIDTSDSLLAFSNFNIRDIATLILGTMITIVGVAMLISSRNVYLAYKKSNIYEITLKKILSEYDYLIVNGEVSVDESRYSNIVYPQKFEEMVDASLNLKSPILYYEAMPGEKSFFIITKDDTLYKYRLTRAYLEKKEMDKQKEK